MRNFALIILFLLSIPFYSLGQICDRISMPSSLHGCKYSTVALNPTLIGTDTVINIRWTPSTGLSDSTILTPNLTVGTTSGWYYLTVKSLSTINLVSNGNFSAGNTGFSSSYSFVPSAPTALWPPGVYVIDTDPHNDHPNAYSFRDHTTGMGNMMAINGASTPVGVWSETISVIPNTDYNFSAWFSNWSSDTSANFPLIQFQVNGGLLGTTTFAFVPTPGRWTQFNSTWNSGINTSATICIYDLQTSYNGNDFAIDDISFRQFCTATDSIFIDVGISDSISNHFDTTVCRYVNNLNLTVPSGYASYTWNTGGTTSSINISNSGLYWVYASGGCGVLWDTFNVQFILPDTLYTHEDTSVCTSVGMMTVEAPAGYDSYLWNTGCSVSSININTGGNYWVYAVNAGGCNVLIDTVHAIFKPLPPVDLGKDTSICRNDHIILRSVQSNGVSYLWSNGFTDSSIMISGGGTYSLTVTQNGCSTTAAIKIGIINHPQLNLGPDTILCSGELLHLPVSANAGVFSWSDGSSGEGFTASVTGMYWATLSNECGIAVDTIHVTYDFCDLWFPSAFTPNGDGLNDIIRVVGSLRDYKDFSLSVFNRWGQRVFYTADIYAGWDGRFNGINQELGTYFYMIFYNLHGKKGMLRGDFELIR
jgi:gliding motility-associated-like protein